MIKRVLENLNAEEAVSIMVEENATAVQSEKQDRRGKGKAKLSWKSRHRQSDESGM